MSTIELPAETHAQPRRTRLPGFERTGILLALIGLAVFAAAFQYRGGLSEYDVYWMLVGMLDGHATGLGTGGAMHYGLVLSFGYYEAAYHLLSDAVLGEPKRLIAAMNSFGYASAIVGLAALAVAVAVAYGERAALVTTVLFGGSPLYLDLSLSGHPILAASAGFFVGAALLFADTRGGWRVLAWGLAVVALFVGLSMRAEALIGFPFLVVARADTRSIRAFVADAALRAVPPALAAVAFFLAQRHYADPQAGGGSGALVTFLQQFYVLSNIAIGFAYILLGVGAVTLLAVGWATLQAIGLLRRAEWRRLAELVLGPAALVVPCLILWMPNPVPVRHFLFLDVGVTLMVAIAVSRLRWSAPATVALLLACLLGNEVVIEAGRPQVMAHFHSPYTNFPEARRTLTTGPLGFVWRHRASMQERHEAYDRQAYGLRGACDKRVIVLSNERYTMVAPLFANGERPKLTWGKIGPFDGVTAIRPGGRRVDFIESYHWWPRDVVAELLAAPSTADAAIFPVPYAVSTYEKATVPPDRQMHGGCDGGVPAS